MTLYRIANWEQHFETCETKKLTHLKWVPVPNKHDGLGFRRIAAQSNCCELFTAWNLILQVASKGRKDGERGILKRQGIPLSAQDLSLMTGFPSKIFEVALAFFSSPEIGWLLSEGTTEVIDNKQPPEKTGTHPAKTGEPPAEWKGMEGNRTEGNESTHIARVNFAIPANESEAIEFAMKAGVLPDFAKALYHQCEGRGWVDGSGNQIQMWSSYAKSRFLKEAFTKPPGSATKREHTPNDIRLIIEAKQSACDALKRKHAHESPLGDEWNDQAKRAEFVKLKKEIKELTIKLGSLG